MADSATARVTGPVLHIDTRSGVSSRTQEPYSITTARVLVDERGLAEVTIPQGMRAPIRGEDVDLVVEFQVYNGRLQARALAPANV